MAGIGEQPAGTPNPGENVQQPQGIPAEVQQATAFLQGLGVEVVPLVPVEKPGQQQDALKDSNQQPQNLPGGNNFVFQLPTAGAAVAGTIQTPEWTAIPVDPGFLLPGFQPSQDELAASIKALQISQREQGIAMEVSKHSTPAAKRSVGFLMRSIYLVKDIQKEWLQLETEAAHAGTSIATQENLPRVNLALTNQGKMVGDLLSKLQHEYTMQTTGSLSGSKWDLVTFIEKKPIFNEEMAEFTLEDMRKFEKEKMSYDSKADFAKKSNNLLVA